MNPFYERLVIRASTIDELLSDHFEVLPGQKGDIDLAVRRLAAWCRSCASGDWSLFGRRLQRDQLTFPDVLSRFASVRRKACAPMPPWIDDAAWILSVLQERKPASAPPRGQTDPFPFEQLLAPVIERAEAILRSNIDCHAADNLSASAYACLRGALFTELSELAAPPLYELLVKMRKANATWKSSSGPQQPLGISLYQRFVGDIKAGGFQSLFEEKPVLLRLMSAITRQWIDASREFIVRLADDLPTIRKVLNVGNERISKVEGGLSDPHNGGRSVKIVTFADGSKVIYKPKDLRVDVAWQNMLERLNRAKTPVELMTAHAIACDGYGWTAFIRHTACASKQDFHRFFQRAGAWLALFHCFAANDMHQENIIAAGDHPVPIDLETILQSSSAGQDAIEPEEAAFDAAIEKLAGSVTAVGLLPAYGRTPDNNIFAMGGMTANWNSKINIKWENINSDEMRPTRWNDASEENPNLPHVNGDYAKFTDHIDDVVSGFEHYARFLFRQNSDANGARLFDGFAGIPVRKVVRATRFYSMLLQRLKNHKAMEDGITWSAQADFIARLADWDTDDDPLWPLQYAERSALLSLNIPHFVSAADSGQIGDAAGCSVRTKSSVGLARARARLGNLDEDELQWQVEVIKMNASRPSKSVASATGADKLQQPTCREASSPPSNAMFIAEADRIADELSRYAIRRGPGAAWIGIDWLGDAEVSQLVPLGPDLYNGVPGICVFLAAHAAVTGQASSRDLALAGVGQLRKKLKGPMAARMARSLGLGGATGVGSIVYALTVMARKLKNSELYADAYRAAELITEDLIAADKRLDVIGGSAGAILSLLCLYREGQSEAVLRQATRCGEYLLAQKRKGELGRRSWVGQGSGQNALNGMSHGAAGFAYALASLSAATRREDFAEAALECIEFENSTFSPERNNWPDLRSADGQRWPCQWCHGAPGIGLARIAMVGFPRMNAANLTNDIRSAVACTQASWPSAIDTLCCGTLGSIEFLCEAGAVLGSKEISETAKSHLTRVLECATVRGDYRWNNGKRQFNLGLFRGLSGVGYSALRQVDPSLPNVLIFE